MGRRKGSKNRTEVTILCEWCGDHTETTRTDTRFCGSTCRSRMRRFVRMAGFEPGYIPGRVTPEDEFKKLVDKLLRDEKARREYVKLENAKAAEISARRAHAAS